MDGLKQKSYFIGTSRGDESDNPKLSVLIACGKCGLKAFNKTQTAKEIEAWWDYVKKKWAEVRNLPKMLNLKTEMSEEHTGRKEGLMRSHA